jgi:outer membrane protein assembly factor BamE (lipoprotein component of BamABCDE complex)
MGNRTSSGLVFGLMMLGLAACSPTYRNHGYVPSDADLEQIVVGVDTQSSLEEAVGRPTSTGVLKDTAWYYIGSRFEHYTYKAPKAVERQIVAVSFDQAGVVRNIERFGLEDGRVITLSRRVTDSSVQGQSFLRRLFGNIGGLDLSDQLGD